MIWGQTREQRYKGWYKCFAWFPVRLNNDNRWAWLQYVEHKISADWYKLDEYRLLGEAT